MTRRLITAVSGVVALIGLGTSSPAHSLAADAHAERFETTAEGYVGCFRSATTAYYACVAALDVGDGTRVVVRAPSPAGAVLHGWYTEDVVVSSEALDWDGSSMTLSAVLPRSGVLDLRATSTQFSDGANGICPGDYQMFYDMRSEQKVVAVDVSDDGSIAGQDVDGLECNSFFVGPTSGLVGWHGLGEDGL